MEIISKKEYIWNCVYSYLETEDAMTKLLDNLIFFKW